MTTMNEDRDRGLAADRDLAFGLAEKTAQRAADATAALNRILGELFALGVDARLTVHEERLVGRRVSLRIVSLATMLDITAAPKR